jgi:hypothetical protein
MKNLKGKKLSKAKKAEALVVAVETVLVLRTCNPDMTSSHGFRWPESGEVSAPDWDPTPQCGGGLHGFLWGCGDSSLANWNESAKWLVVEVPADSIVELSGKVKFPKGTVVYCGSRLEATAMIAKRKEGAIMGHSSTAGTHGTATAGYAGTATAGDSGTATAGTHGTATAGDSGTATAGDSGTATAGYAGTATAGDSGTATAGTHGTATAGTHGTATAGENGILVLRYWDEKANRYRLVVGYVGEDEIKACVRYKLDAEHRFEACEG